MDSSYGLDQSPASDPHWLEFVSWKTGRWRFIHTALGNGLPCYSRHRHIAPPRCLPLRLQQPTIAAAPRIKRPIHTAHRSQDCHRTNLCTISQRHTSRDCRPGISATKSVILIGQTGDLLNIRTLRNYREASCHRAGTKTLQQVLQLSLQKLCDPPSADNDTFTAKSEIRHG